MEGYQAFLTKTSGEVEQLQSELQDTCPTPDVLRQQLLRIYEVICCLSEYDRTEDFDDDELLDADTALLKVWDQLFELVKSLSPKPNGLFLASRFILFILQGYGCQKTLGQVVSSTTFARSRIQFQTQYIQALDECLLSFLRQIWRESGGTEYFSWATTYLKHVRSDHNKAAMIAISPKELFKVPGLAQRQLRASGSREPPYHKQFEHVNPAVSGEVDETGQQIPHPDGPIAWPDISFCLIGNYGRESWIRRPCLRRSWQFVLDTRQHLNYKLTSQLATRVMAQARLPSELQLYILENFEPIRMHPYLSHFDIAEAYQPFPSSDFPGDKCTTCIPTLAERTNAIRAKTCPRRTTTIWNLGLRMFHTFHEGPGNCLYMCRKENICEGHHEDYTWVIETDAQLVNHVRNLVRRRCGEGATMSSIGLGTKWTFENPLDCPRNRQRFTFGLEDQQLDMIASMEGGIYGLLPTMLHRKTARNTCPPDSKPHEECSMAETEEEVWMLGRSTTEERRVAQDLCRMHSNIGCAYPEFCQAITGRLAEEDEAAPECPHFVSFTDEQFGRGDRNRFTP